MNTLITELIGWTPNRTCSVISAEIRQAYETLSNPQVREAYDRKLDKQVPVRPQPRRAPAEWVKEVFPRNRRRVVEVYPSDPFEEFDRVFEMFFRRF